MKKNNFMLMVLSSIFLLAACSPPQNNVDIAGDDLSVEVENTSVEVENTSRVFVEGRHYTTLKKPISLNHDDDFVIKYLWLGCEHCQNFEEIIGEYSASNPDVLIERRHAALTERWALDARVFYALFETGNGHKYLDLMDFYKEMRLNYRKLPDFNELYEFFGNIGINAEELFTVADSDVVLGHIAHSITDLKENEINGVPAIIVAGKYHINANLPSDIQGQSDYNELVNYLLRKNKKNNLEKN